MGLLRGQQGSVEFETGSGSVAQVASTRSWSLDIEKETIDVTKHGDTFRNFIGGLIAGSGTIELIFDEGNAGQKTFIDDVLKTNDQVDASFELFREGSDNGQKSYTFGGIIENISISSTVGELVTVTAGFRSSGTIGSN